MCIGLRTGWLILGLPFLASCGGSGGESFATTPPAGTSAATRYTVTVTAADPAESPAFGTAHYAYINPSVLQQNRLFVFFGATDAPPQNYALIEAAAADAGLYSIGLAYPNGPDPVNASNLCGSSTDPDCTGKIREEVLTGTDTSPLISVSVADSVQNRLAKALFYLDRQHPGDGWGQFLDAGNNVRWDLVRVSGLSQGGGLAGYIAKTRVVDRACLFSSPADWDNVANRPAAWVLNPVSMTPASKIFGFNDRNDPVVPYPRIVQTWTALGLDGFGAPADVDTTASFNGTHKLYTDQGTVLSAHTSTAADSTTPVDAGRPSTQFPAGLPIYLNVWSYACFS